ncbi:MAG: cell division protein FtsH, partial [Thermomicrobiales bacterium]
RGRALGVTIQMPTEDKYNYPKQYLVSRLAVMMGGRAAEMIVFNEVTTGAQSDLKESTALAKRMVGLWGMSDEIGPIYLGTGEQHVFLGRELTQDRDMSAATMDLADQAVRTFIEAGLQTALKLLTERRTDMDNLARRLMEEETLDEEQITELLGAPPVPSEVAALERTTLD